MGEDYELGADSAAVKLADEPLHDQHGSVARDEADLMRLGKKPVLKVSCRSP